MRYVGGEGIDGEGVKRERRKGCGGRKVSLDGVQILCNIQSTTVLYNTRIPRMLKLVLYLVGQLHVVLVRRI